ncbi:hypothetical protein BC829DRAFT_493874 [Chytridium lagenaria]|nr:hypothetical protein BC829DRAFT_493874 [Chytridium lagenaria]
MHKISSHILQAVFVVGVSGSLLFITAWKTIKCKAYTADDNVFNFIPSQKLVENRMEQVAFAKMGIDYFRVFFGPASGPRCFATVGFEAQIKDLVLRNKITRPKWLVGASTSALRFYGSPHLPRNKARHLRPLMEKCYRICAPDDAIDAALTNPLFNIAIMVANINPKYRHIPDWYLKTILVYYGLKNLVDPKYLAGLVSRICFYTGEVEPKFLEDGLGGKESIKFVKLTKKNVYAVLHATTCIPFISVFALAPLLERCTHIPEFGDGFFVDGALTDYTLNVHLRTPDYPALLLGDCLTRHFSPTIFDNKVPWRIPPKSFFDQCSLIHPSPVFLTRVPDRTLPSVADWFKTEYIENPAKRHRNWRVTYEVSERCWAGVMKGFMERIGRGDVWVDEEEGTVLGKVVQMRSEFFRGVQELFPA